MALRQAQPIARKPVPKPAPKAPATARKTQPVARASNAPKLNVAPAATSAPAGAHMAFDTSQWSAIDAAVAQSLTGIQAGNTVGGFANIFRSDLLANKGTNPDGSAFTVAQANALAAGYETAAGGGAGFRDQGNSAAPFDTAWDARLKTMFGTIANPAPAAAPAAAPRTAPAIAPVPVLQKTTPAATSPVPGPMPGRVLPVAWGVIPSPPPLPADPPSVAHSAAAGGSSSSSSSSALQTTTGGTSAAVADGTTSDATTAALLKALAGSSAGLTSPDSSVGTPSTAGLQEITPVASPSTSTSNPAVVAIVAAIALAGGGFLVYRLAKKKKGATSTPGAHNDIATVSAPRPITT